MIKFSRRRRFLLLLFSSGPGPGPFATIIYLPLCMLFWMFIAFALGRLLTLSDGVSVFIGALFTLPTLALVNLWAVRVVILYCDSALANKHHAYTHPLPVAGAC